MYKRGKGIKQKPTSFHLQGMHKKYVRNYYQIMLLMRDGKLTVNTIMLTILMIDQSVKGLPLKHNAHRSSACTWLQQDPRRAVCK